MKDKNESRIVMHIVSLVLGIISILTSLFWYMSIPTGIVAIIFGVKSYKKIGSKLGLAGMITGIVGLALSLLIYITLFIILILENGGIF
ncbi:MAG: DUF4190 domain-containing protein [Bacilli bacterium]|nr:DUF4190 domain-containing protein [Bacilli bacterium]